MRLLLSLIFLCVLTPNINCFFEFLSVDNPIFLNENVLEKGILEPIVYQRELKDRNGNRYFEEDLVKFDELNQSPVSEELTSASNEVEQLPSDSAYFYTQQQQQQQQLQNEQPDDYFEVPKRSNIYLRVPQEQQYQSDEQQQQQLPLDDDNSSVESFEAVQAVVNPFESFLDSIVGSNQEESNQEEQIEKRVFVLPAPLVPEEQIAELPYTRPQLGLIDLITNRANRFESSEYNSPEFGSNEEERNRILQLQPVRTLFWDDELNRDALVPSVGLIDSVNARKYGYGDDSSSTEFERQQRAFILRPNSYWSREEGLQNESEENRSADIPEAEDKNEVFERIKENLDQEQQKFMENLLDDQVLSKNHQQQQQQQDQHDQQQFQMVDDNKELSETLPQVQDNYIEIKLKKKIERHEAEDLLSFISQLTAIDSSLIKDINVDGDRIWFRLDGVESEEDLGLFVQEILNHERQIQQEKGLTIVSSNLISNPNIENIEKRKQAATSQQDANAKKFFLITVTVCGSVLAILITLVAIFVIRRRAYLRNKLIDELNLPKKKKFDDVERLVDADYTEQSRFTKLMGRLCSYKQKNEKNDVESQQDLDATTPNKDTEKILSRQSHQDYQELCRSEEFVPTHLMTTPVTTNTEMTRKSNVAESTRSSTSS